MTDATPDPGTLDDHAFAVWAAERAGEVLLRVRAESGLEGKALKDAGDAAAQELLARVLAEHRPDDAVLSEEATDDKARLCASRVWIIDPLDGTREFSEPPRDDWAVHVALWEASAGGDGLTAGAVAQPALGETFNTGAPSAVPPRTSTRPRIAVSRTRPPAFVEALAAEIDAELVPMGSAGVKVMSVVRDLADAYVHAGGQYQWDNAAPGRRGPGRRPALLAGRRLAAGLQRGRHLAAGPDRVPARARRADHRVRQASRHRLTLPLRRPYGSASGCCWR